MQNWLGAQLGNYRLMEFLGRGGQASVYLGQHLHLQNKQTAIKILHAHLSDEDIEAFRREADMIVGLKHPHIINVLDFDVRQGTAFLVMEYYPNGTLRKRHPRGTRVPLMTVASYVQQISEALQYAHDHRVIHRDVKPSNMLLGPDDEVVLSDFGIAAIAHSTSSMLSQTSAGSPPYIAPEQISEYPRTASDQYAVGVVVYEWLTGAPPFVGTAQEIYGKHLRTAPASLCQQFPDIPRDVERVIFTALSKDPKERFAAMRAFAKAFSVAAQPPTYQPVPGQTGSHPPVSPMSGAIPVVRPTDVSLVAPTVTDVHSQYPPFPEKTPTTQGGSNSYNATGQVLPVTTLPAGSQNGPPNRFLSRRNLLIFALVAILIIASGAGILLQQEYQRQESANATATVETAKTAAFVASEKAQATSIANAAATTHAQATGRAVTATAEVQATSQSIAGSTATAIASNPFPSYLEGKGSLIFYDSFKLDGVQWLGQGKYGESVCEYMNDGTYRMSVKDAFTFFTCNTFDNFNNFAVEVQMEVRQGDCGGLEVRADTGIGSGYIFLVCSNGTYEFTKYIEYKAETARILFSGSSNAIKRGTKQNNLIAVVANGRSFKLYINTRLITTVESSDFPSGSIGLIASDTTVFTEVFYREMKVWGLK